MGVRTDVMDRPGLGAALRDELTTVRKAFYGVAGLGFGCVEYIVAVYLLKYYTDYTLLDPVWAGLALMLAKVFDGVSDPIMGYLSDRTKTRWGRRRPWFIAGAIPLVIGFVAMFAPPADLTRVQLFWWLTFSNMLFFVGTTMVEVPHAAFGGEVTKTHHERVSIMGWRQGFTSTGLFIGAVAPMVFIQSAAKRAGAAAAVSGGGEDAIRHAAHTAAGSAHSTIALVFGAIVLFAFCVTFIGTREPAGPKTPPRDSIFGDFLDTFASRPFRFFMLPIFFGEVAGALTATLVLYAIGDWWGLRGHEAPLISCYLLTGILSIPVWVWLGRGHEKHHMFAVGALMAAVSLCGMLLTPRIGLWWAYAMLIFSGLGFGARAVMNLAMMPDIIDEDELRTRTRKDGAYFGMWSLLRKLTRALALGLSGIGLGYFGYQKGVLDQPAEAVRGIAVMYAVVPAAMLFLAGFLILLFPLTRSRHADTLEQLEQRSRASTGS